MAGLSARDPTSISNSKKVINNSYKEEQSNIACSLSLILFKHASLLAPSGEQNKTSVQKE